VTLFAAVLPGSGGELALVLILVAIQALRKLDFVLGFLAGRDVTCSALDCGMREGQRKLGLRMIRVRESARNPSLDGVAAFAAAFVASLEELAAMGIGLVAIRTVVVWDRRLEVSSLVAGFARDGNVLAEQGEVRL